MNDRIDNEGFRANVGIVLSNEQRQLFFAGRIGGRGWQFPQGGIQADESPEEAMYRELQEEIGLLPAQVDIVAECDDWLRYRLPRRYQRRHCEPLCIGQKQRWFLLRLTAEEQAVRLDHAEEPEFDRWRWVSFWQPLEEVIYFKRDVYARALEQFAPLLFPDGDQPERPAQRRRRNSANGSSAR